MTLLEKIEYLKIEKNLNNHQLSNQSSIPYNTIRNFWNQGVDNMHLKTFKTLCDFFNVTTESMAYDDREIQYRDDVSADSLSREETELIKMYEKLDARGKDTVLSAVRIQFNQVQDEEKESAAEGA